MICEDLISFALLYATAAAHLKSKLLTFWAVSSFSVFPDRTSGNFLLLGSHLPGIGTSSRFQSLCTATATSTSNSITMPWKILEAFHESSACSPINVSDRFLVLKFDINWGPMGASLLPLAKHILIPSRGSVMPGDMPGLLYKVFIKLQQFGSWAGKYWRSCGPESSFEKRREIISWLPDPQHFNSKYNILFVVLTSAAGKWS